MSARVLVADYPGGQVIAGARALWRAGDRCELAWPRRFADRLTPSRAFTRWHPIPSAITDPDDYIDALIDLCRARPYDLLLPFGLDACHAVARRAAELAPHVAFALPAYPTFRLANDKAATARHAAALGLRTPTVYSDAAPDDIAAVARAARYPVVIKARSGSGVTDALRYAADPDSLLRAYDEMTARAGRAGVRDYTAPLIQEYVPGHIHDVCTVSWRGEVIAALTQVRQLMKPIDGGVGAINRTTDDPTLRAHAVRLLESLDYHGPAQVEFKRDARDGSYALIELNPKLWGTLPLSIAAGLDVPGLIRDLVLGRPVERMPAYRVGLRQAFLFPQATHALYQLGRRFGWRALWRARAALWPDTIDLDPRDPLPDLRRAAGALTRLVRDGVDESNAGIAPANPPDSIG